MVINAIDLRLDYSIWHGGWLVKYILVIEIIHKGKYYAYYLFMKLFDLKVTKCTTKRKLGSFCYLSLFKYFS